MKRTSMRPQFGGFKPNSRSFKLTQDSENSFSLGISMICTGSIKSSEKQLFMIKSFIGNIDSRFDFELYQSAPNKVAL